MGLWLRRSEPQAGWKIQNSHKPAFSHGVQLGCVKARSTTNVMFDCQTILSLYTHMHTHADTLTLGEYWVSSLRGRMISPTLLFHLFTHNYQPAKGLSSRLSLNWNSKGCNYSNQQRWLHNTPTQTALLRSHTVDIDSNAEPRFASALEDRDCHDGWVYAFQAAGHHQLGALEPPFPASRWPLPAPISPGTGPGIQSHGRGGRRLQHQSSHSRVRQINAG